MHEPVEKSEICNEVPTSMVLTDANSDYNRTATQLQSFGTERNVKTTAHEPLLRSLSFLPAGI